MSVFVIQPKCQVTTMSYPKVNTTSSEEITKTTTTTTTTEEMTILTTPVAASEFIPDPKAPFTPTTCSIDCRTCLFCPDKRCLQCVEPNSTFRNSLYFTSDDDFRVPNELILGQPGWQCCQCDACQKAVPLAISNHKVPREFIQEVFGPKHQVNIVRSGGQVEKLWRILAAVRLSTGTGIVAIVCSPTAPVWKNVPLEKLIEWNSDVKIKASIFLRHWLSAGSSRTVRE